MSKISIFIDSCAWNYLYEHEIDLAREVPSEIYAIYLTQEVEREIADIPCVGKNGEGNRHLKQYIDEAVSANKILTTRVFGFRIDDEDGSPSKYQPYSGFDQGTFQSTKDRKWYASEPVKEQLIGKAVKASGLSNNQADASLAVRSFDSIILTDERKDKSGPLRLASEEGGLIVFLHEEFEPTGLALGAYLAMRWEEKRMR